jgi:hypothetical protein
MKRDYTEADLREVLAETAARHRPTIAILQAVIKNVDMEAKHGTR